MGLFDVMDDIAQKQVLKTDTGDNRITGVVVGKVVKNYEEGMVGRVCVSIPVRDSGEEGLKWARLAFPSFGSEWGHYFLPEVGDQVLVVFEQGNIERPFVIGCVPKDKDKFLKQSATEKNDKKRIVTKHGNAINFIDSSEDGGDSGEKDRIEIVTATNQHYITLDNDKKKLTIGDKDKKCLIELNTDPDKGEITIKADKKITFQAGDVTLVLNGNNTRAELKNAKFKVSDAESIEFEAQKSLSMSAPNFKAEAGTSLKLSGGAVSVSGSPIKMG